MDERTSPESSISIHEDDELDKSSSSTDAEDLINPGSHRFNPQLAILCATSDISIPCRQAPRYLNIFELEKAVPDPRHEPIFQSVLEKSKAKLAKLKAQHEQTQQKSTGTSNDSKVVEEKVTEDKNKPSTSKSSVQIDQSKNPETPFYPIPGRKFLPHQLPVFRPRKEHPNVLIKMKTAQGPLSVLRQVMASRQRIKIWTRNNNGIRGFCTGIVLAFDTHWNLILCDVYEIFQRKRPDKIKGPNVHKSSCHKPDENKCTNSNDLKNLMGDKTLKSTSECILIEGLDALITLRLHFDTITQYVNSRQRTTSVPESVTSQTVTKAQLRKKHFSIFKEPRTDAFGFTVLGQSKHYEIVQRLQKQLFLMGNDISFIEPTLKS